MHLAKLLDEPERKVSKAIAKLEGLSGYHSEDVRLLAESRQVLRHKLSQLGLDPDDTTAEELYQALQVKLKNDLAHLDRAWQLGDAPTARVLEILASIGASDELLAVKGSTMKSLLKALPPKKTLKLLGYRSFESMLKREDAKVVLAVAISAEGAPWNSKLAHKIAQLKTSDYELRPLKFLAINSKKAHTLKPVTTVPLMAAVVLNSSSLDGPLAAGSVLLALEAEAILISENKQLAAHQFSKDFNKIAERLFSGYAPLTSRLEHDFMDLEDYKNRRHQPEPYNKFSGLHTALAWWKDCGHIAFSDDGAVSLHLTDCLTDLLSGSDFNRRFSHNFAAALKRKLAARYYDYQSVKNYLGGQIDDTFISLDSISAKNLAPDFEEIRNL